MNATRVTLTRPIGKRSVPALTAGKARVVVTATRPVLFGYRAGDVDRDQDVDVRLTPPRVGVVSMHHYVNHGGSEMVVYRVTPADVDVGRARRRRRCTRAIPPPAPASPAATRR